MIYGGAPVFVGDFDINLPEVMHYLYLPVQFPDGEQPPNGHDFKGLFVRGFETIRLPPNVEVCRKIIEAAIACASERGRDVNSDYVYLSARKGWASPDNPLNRPGWHADGFGTDDLNFVWWAGPGTRFAVQEFMGISVDHLASLEQFEEQIDPAKVLTYPERRLYVIDAGVVHATPELTTGCWRQYVKVSLSRHRYNLENNSHNYLFNYSWPLHSRDVIRNDPHKAQLDYVA